MPAAAFSASPAPGAPDDPRPRSYALIGKPAPDFALPKLGGGVARPADYHGRVLILYFGGLWCPDCQADGAYVDALSKQVAREHDIAFLQIHTRNSFGKWAPQGVEATPADAEKAVRDYFSAAGYSYPVAFDATRTFAKEVYAIAWSPTYLVIDRQGVIRDWRTNLGPEGVSALIQQARKFAY
jgi:thiol-disulfide isomerase/thioredoxin